MVIEKGDTFTKSGLTATVTRITSGYRIEYVTFEVDDGSGTRYVSQTLTRAQFIAAWGK